MSDVSNLIDFPKKPWEILAPARQTAAAVFASPHSGAHYPASFVEGSPLGRLALRRSEDSFVDQLFIAAPDHGAPPPGMEPSPASLSSATTCSTL